MVRTLIRTVVRVTLALVALGVVGGTYFGVPFVIAELGDGGAMTTCMGIAQDQATSDGPEDIGFGTEYQAFPVAGVLCRTRQGTTYMGWAG